MAIMAAAAIVGGGAVAAGVAATTIAMVGIAVTVVGVIAESESLMKIGAGLGLGGGAASMMGLGQSAAQAAAPSIATEGTNLAIDGGLSVAGEQAAQAASMNVNLTGSPQLAAASAPGPSAAAISSAPAAPIPTKAAAATSAWSGQAATELPKAANWYEANKFVGTRLQNADQHFGAIANTRVPAPIAQVKAAPPPSPSKGIMDSIGSFWNGLDTSGKLAVGQMGMGLLQGVGEGMMASRAGDAQADLIREQRDFQRSQRIPTIRLNTNRGLIDDARRI